MRGEIEDAFNMDAVDIYGLSEVLGPQIANECVETRDGLNVWEDYFYPEIINPETGEALPDGELGERVFTTLTKEDQPTIRFRTRDLARLLLETARTIRRMEKSHRPQRRHDHHARRQFVPDVDQKAGAEPAGTCALFHSRSS